MPSKGEGSGAVARREGAAYLPLDERQAFSGLAQEHVQGPRVVHMLVLPEAMLHSAQCVRPERESNEK